MLQWYERLTRKQANAVHRYASLLGEAGVDLGFPYSSDLRGTKYPFRELRITAEKHELRVIYAFDPRRDAVLLIGGDKTGDKRFYEKIIPWAEKIWEQYLAEQARGLQDKED